MTLVRRMEGGGPDSVAVSEAPSSDESDCESVPQPDEEMLSEEWARDLLLEAGVVGAREVFKIYFPNLLRISLYLKYASRRTSFKKLEFIRISELYCYAFNKKKFVGNVLSEKHKVLNITRYLAFHTPLLDHIIIYK